jgi:dTMP kinase
MRKGTFISIEGPEGAGKSTQREFIVEWLTAAGIEVVKTREPGGTPLAERIREILLTISDELMANKTELLLLFAARAQHIETVIRPAIERGAVVVCDRFIDSTYAYQVAGRGVPVEEIDNLVKYTCANCMPDITFVFDIDSETGLKRASLRGMLDRFELSDKAFFARVNRSYRESARSGDKRFVLIDASVEREQVQAQLIPTLQQIVNKHHSRLNVQNEIDKSNFA